MSIAELCHDIDDRRAMRPLRKLVQSISESDRLRIAEEEIEKLKAAVAELQGKLPKHSSSIPSLVSPRCRPELLIRIRFAVSRATGVSVETIVRRQRGSKIVSDARFACCWLARELTDFTLTEIGHAFGMGDHGAIKSALRAIPPVG